MQLGKDTMSNSIPSETKVVVIGGGVVGASVAYHLAKFGWKDVVLLEQNQLAGGTTWHAAGLVGRLRTTNSMTKINKYSADLYAGLEKETGHPVRWKQVGSLIVGRSPERMTQLRRTDRDGRMVRRRGRDDLARSGAGKVAAPADRRRARARRGCRTTARSSPRN